MREADSEVADVAAEPRRVDWSNVARIVRELGGDKDSETARRKARRAHFHELVARTPRGRSLGFGRDRARKELRHG